MQLLQILYLLAVVLALLVPPALLIVGLIRRRRKVGATFVTLLGLRLTLFGTAYNAGYLLLNAAPLSRGQLVSNWWLVWAILVSWFCLFGILTLRNYRERVSRYWDERTE